MNQIELDPAILAGELFDQVLLPLADARRVAGAGPFFPLGPDSAVPSYFAPSKVGSMKAEDFEFPGGGEAVGLVKALVAHWADEGETGLVNAGPKLHAIAASLAADETPQDGAVDIFCYTLF